MKEAKDLTRAYLLGTLNEEERDAIEAGMFADDTYLLDFEDAEQKLIEQYLEGILSHDERDRFEEHFLASPRRRRSLELTQALIRIAEVVRKPETAAERKNWLARAFQPLWHPYVIAVNTSIIALVSVGLSGWLGVRLMRERNAASSQQRRWSTELEQANQEIEQLRHNKTIPPRTSVPLPDVTRDRRNSAPKGSSGDLALPNSRQNDNVNRSPVLASFTLMPGLFRDRDERVLKIAPEATTIQFNLKTDVVLTARRYAVTIRRENVDNSWQSDAVARVSDHAAMVSVPSAILEPGGYMLTLSTLGTEGAAGAINDYSFRVAR